VQCAPNERGEARLGMAVGGAKVLYQGLWPTRTCATLGAAATAARVWGLTEPQTRNALALAGFAFVPAVLGMAMRALQPDLSNSELALPRLTTDVLPPWIGGLE